MNNSKKLIENISQCIVGKHETIMQVVAALLCRGHVLIEDVPGVGKTVLAKALSRSLDAVYKRIQMTPDMLPADITGVPIYNQEKHAFEFRQGPVFTQILLADELNRATPRTQSALLESMEERQVSVDGETHDLPRPFFVIATQNPVEQHGVYHLPEAQLDRFMIQVSLGYPDLADEIDVLNQQMDHHPLEDVKSVISAADIIELQQQVANIFIEPSVTEYIVRLCQQTRRHDDLILGGSPRASLALQRMAQAWTLIEGKQYVLPDTVKYLFLPVLRHRVTLKPQARISGVKVDDVLLKILSGMEAPVLSGG